MALRSGTKGGGTKVKADGTGGAGTVHVPHSMPSTRTQHGKPLHK